MGVAQVRGAVGPVAGKAAVPARRMLDLIIAGAGLIVLGPVIVLVALAIWIESGRPILFSQTRLGLFGRHFRMYKFRKFRRQIGTDGCGVTVKDDQRLTKLGAFLAKTKLDELPQLWNVLRGDMSTVGPRPESLNFADCMTRGYLGVLEHKPGIFGPNQLYFRDEASLYPDACDPEEFYRDVLFPVKANIDLAYFPNRTFAGDVGWITRSVLRVFGLRALPKKFTAILAGWLEHQDQQQSANGVHP